MDALNDDSVNADIQPPTAVEIEVAQKVFLLKVLNMKLNI
jgi:hypothetical protein